ncbi:MAG: hypothetical protein BAJALOKI3v1_280002 [Promethearchaeota archaeon]|nr:MAG: hypothetical protein BAJALOKI3v1_280002 [Candidatus Lokiarchaeota archaeon]
MAKPYYCTLCMRKHHRGQIYDDHLKYKEKEIKIENIDKFIMKGRMGEDLEVRTKELNNALRINIYKQNELACTTDVEFQKESITKGNIRNYIQNNCI